MDKQRTNLELGPITFTSHQHSKQKNTKLPLDFPLYKSWPTLGNRNPIPYLDDMTNVPILTSPLLPPSKPPLDSIHLKKITSNRLLILLAFTWITDMVRIQEKTGWWFQPIWDLKNMSQNGFIFPKVRGESKKYLKPSPRKTMLGQFFWGTWISDHPTIWENLPIHEFGWSENG